MSRLPFIARGLAGSLGVLSLFASAPAQAQALAPPSGLALSAPIALLTDLGSGRVLYARDVRRRFMPASLTKIMTAYVAFELIAAKKLRPGQRFAMSDAAFERWHRVGSSMYLARGQAVSVDELLTAIMTVSANDGCIVLAEGVSGSVERFVELMNAEARRLGMRNSRFGTPNGWPDEGATYTTAEDLATLTRAMLVRHPALYRRYVGRTEMTFNGILQHNHVPLLGKVAGADGVKTGFTNESGYGLVGSAMRDGRRLVMVGAGFDRPRVRADESRALIEWGFSAWNARRLFARGAVVGNARVQGGAARRVALTAPQAIFLTLAPGERASYHLALRYRGPVQAPIARGALLGELVVRADGQPPRTVPLVAARAVDRAGFWARLRNGVLGLVGL